MGRFESSSGICSPAWRRNYCAFFYQLAALLYKNLILGVRLWRSTLCYMIIPCLMVIIFGAIVAGTANNGEVRNPQPFAAFSSTASADISGIERGIPRCRVFDTVGGRYGRGVPIPNSKCISLAYAPANNPVVVDVMKRLAKLNNVEHALASASTDVDVVGFLTEDDLLAYSATNPAEIGHGVVFPDSFIINVNDSIAEDPAGVPTIPIQVLYNKTASGQFYGASGDDLLAGAVAIVSTPLQVHRAVVEAVLSIHTGSMEASVSFDVGKLPTTSDQDATSSLENLIGIFVYLGIMIPFMLTIRLVVSEKENNILDAMRTTGLLESAYWVSWFIYLAIIALLSTALMYIAGVAIQAPIFMFVDGPILFSTLYFYFLATLCFALFLASVIPSTRIAVMVGFAFLAVGIVAQAIFTMFGMVRTLVYNPHIVPTAGLKALNLYPPIQFSRLVSDFSYVIAPYFVEGVKEMQRNRYTMADFHDGVYRYGEPTNPAAYSLTNSTSCIDDADPSKYPGAVCYKFSAGCPTINFIPQSPCPQVMCSSDWAAAHTSTASCLSAGGVMVAGGVCECRYVTTSDYQSMLELLGLIPLYLLLAWYFGQIFTYGHGRAEPFYFPLLPWYWFPSLKKNTNWEGVFGTSTDDLVLAEEQKVKSGEYDTTRPVVVRGLKKVFGLSNKFTAVNGLSFSMEQGKCFALLGHNGAGKTTAIKMLSGLISITEGDVLVDGISIRNSLGSVRKYIGACPQHDILWPELSAYQHLKFYGIFQGMSDREAAIQSMLEAVRLNKEKSNPSSSFSGGMKRRLSVAIASLGDKRVVVLDEPTTGMDPQNRSHVWKMISNLKKDRVVLLTTHSMEEAEYLGDNIGIMSHGHLIALGTTLKLKSKFGGGYRLNLVVSGKQAGAKVREAVSRCVPGAVLVDQSASDMSYELPGSADHQLPELFRWIESQEKVLNDWGVNQVSLEDIFIRLTKDDAKPQATEGKAGKPKKAGKKDAAAAAATATAVAVTVDGNDDGLNGIPEATVAEGANGGEVFSFTLDPEQGGVPDEVHQDAGAVQDDEPMEDPRKNFSWFFTVKSQSRGLFYKNFALLKRNRCTLLCQCLFPLLLVSIIFAIKYSIESSIGSSSGNFSPTTSNCKQCIHEASNNHKSNSENFEACLLSDTLEQCLEWYDHTGLFAFKEANLGTLPDTVWDEWDAEYTGYDYVIDDDTDLVMTNPVYAFCATPNTFFSSGNPSCIEYESQKNQTLKTEPANFFGANPIGRAYDAPVRYLVVGNAGLDIGSKCYNNGSTPLYEPDNRTMYYTFSAMNGISGSDTPNNIQSCNRWSDSQGRQFPNLRSDQHEVLGTGALTGCDVFVTDEEAYIAAKANSDSDASGLLGYFPSEISESTPKAFLKIIYPDPESIASLTLQEIYGTYNVTATCSSSAFNNVQWNLPLSEADFVNFVRDVRDNGYYYFDTGLPQGMNDYSGTSMPHTRVRLDACYEFRQRLFESPALCPMKAYGDVSSRHLSQPTLKEKVDRYTFDMQEMVKNEVGFAAEPKPAGPEGIFEARMDILNHFPDASIMIEEFDPAKSILKYSMQAYYKTGYGNEYSHAKAKINKCYDTFKNPVAGEPLRVDPSNPDYLVEQCAKESDLTADFIPVLRADSWNRYWGRKHDIQTDDFKQYKIAGEETFIFSGIATAALRYATDKGHSVPESPVTDPNTQFLLGIRPLPYKTNDRTADTLAILETVTSMMVILLVPFAITMLWPMFAYHFVHEKELKLRAMQSMMGMRTDCYFLVSYVFDFIVAFTMLTLIYLLGFFMSIPFFSRNQGSLIMLLFFIWANTLVAMGFFFQTFFSRTRTSNVILCILVLASVVGAFILNFQVFTSSFLPAPDWYLIWPPFVAFRAIHLLSKRSFFLTDLTLEEELGRLFGILFLETLILLFASLYLDMVIPREYGRPRHPLFFIVEPYREWRRRRRNAKTSKSSDVDDATSDETGYLGPNPVENEDADVAAERILVEGKQYSRPPAVEIIHLKKVYASGKVAVEDVTLHMETGEVFCLLGPNGAGKSTVIGVLTGLFSGTGGKANINGFDVKTEMPRIYERLGVTPQFDTLWPTLTVMEHLLYYSRLKGIPRHMERTMALKAAKSVRLENALNKRSRQLSGGMRRRLSLAISLVGNPQTIFLDEPTTGLDPETRRQIWQLIEREKKERCIVLTTHSMEEAEALASRVAIMAHGLVKTVGTTMQLKAKYGEGYRIQVGFTSGNENKVDAFVKGILPTAELVEERSSLRVYKVTKENGPISNVFDSFLKRNVQESGVEDWAIEQSTLEQVFLKIAAESERVYGTA